MFRATDVSPYFDRMRQMGMMTPEQEAEVRRILRSKDRVAAKSQFFESANDLCSVDWTECSDRVE